MKNSLLALSLAFFLAFSAPAKAADEEFGLLKEVGLTFGTPGFVNLNLGVWGTPSLPIPARVSGGYYGSFWKGIQGDLGWAFDQAGSFRQYIALSWTTMRQDNSTSFFNYTGMGAAYGLNWGGFSFQGSFYFPTSDSNVRINRVGTTKLEKSIGFQIGYGFIW